MPFLPPLIKPPLPPLRPPVAPPYRPPGPNRLPPTQTGPIYQPPDLLPTTGLDLKGVVCIYSNAPKWEPKKIRYRYPGESWQEIAGENYTTTIESTWNPLPLFWYLMYFEGINFSNQVITGFYGVEGGFTLTRIINGTADETGDVFLLKDRNGTRNRGDITSGPWRVEEYSLPPRNQYFWQIKKGSFKITRVINESDRQEIFPQNQCTFKVFNAFNQQILSITRDVCPEVIVVPERCYFKAENERLVARVIQTLLDPPLRIEYQGHCATVWKDGIINLPPYPLQIYKEFSDNPSCPPPRIRFDQKCEEKCEQCPLGTAVRVLLGNRIACVDAFRCIKKIIKYKSGCNKYDCICS